jgi:NAD(P)H-hydrate epimerase
LALKTWKSKKYVISVDINSGMNGDTGEGELAVVSDLTVSIGSVKQGLFNARARARIGKLVNADIGISMN